MRIIFLDTETTGFSPKCGHRITEIGCVEMIDGELTGNNFHTYLNPERELDASAARVTRLTREFLSTKPKFSEIADDLVTFIADAELIMHNAPFDLRFLNNELALIKHQCGKVEEIAKITDTLVMARKLFSKKKNQTLENQESKLTNTIKDLCQRFEIPVQNSLHGALVDANYLVPVWQGLVNSEYQQSLIEAKAEAKAKLEPDVARPVLDSNPSRLCMFNNVKLESEHSWQKVSRRKRSSVFKK